MSPSRARGRDAEPEPLTAEGLRDAVVRVAERDGPNAAAELIGRHWDTFANTSPAQLLAAVRALPGEVFIDNAGMVVAANYLQHIVDGGEPHRFERDPRIAIDPASSRGSLAEQLIGLTGTAATERTRGRFRRAASAAREGRRRLNAARDDEVSTVRANLPHLFVQWGRALEDAADDPGDAEYEYEESHRLGMSTGQLQVARRAAGHLAWYHAVRGRTSTAASWLERARTTGEPNPRYDAVNHLSAALIALDHEDPEGADVELRILNEHEVGEYWAAALWVRSFGLRSTAEHVLLETETAREVERRASDVVGGGMNGRLVRATWMRLGRPMTPPEATTALDAALVAAHEYRRGDFHRAIHFALWAVGPTAPPRVRADALLITAASAFALGRSTVAEEQFGLAHSIIQRERIATSYESVSPEHLLALAERSRTTLPVRSGAVTRAGTSALLAGLTPRERQVLAILPTDLTMADIAAEFFISPNTLKATTRRLYRKLGVSSRSAAADIAQRAGLHAR